MSNYILKLNSSDELADSISFPPPHTWLFRDGSDSGGPRINVVKFYDRLVGETDSVVRRKTTEAST